MINKIGLYYFHAPSLYSFETYLGKRVFFVLDNVWPNRQMEIYNPSCCYLSSNAVYFLMIYIWTYVECETGINNGRNTKQIMQTLFCGDWITDKLQKWRKATKRWINQIIRESLLIYVIPSNFMMRLYILINGYLQMQHFFLLYC